MAGTPLLRLRSAPHDLLLRRQEHVWQRAAILLQRRQALLMLVLLLCKALLQRLNIALDSGDAVLDKFGKIAEQFGGVRGRLHLLILYIFFMVREN